MKIMVIASLFAPYARGGAEVVTEQIVEELSRSHDVSVLTCDRWKGIRSFRARREKSGTFSIYRFFPLNFFSFVDINEKPFYLRFLWTIGDFFNIHALIETRNVLNEVRPDIVMTHNIKGLTYGIPWLLRTMKVRHVHVPHDVQLVFPSGLLIRGQERLLESPWVRAYSALTRMLFGSPEVVVCASKFLKQFYVQRGFFPRSNIIVLRNPVPPKADGLLPATESDERIHFLFIGNLASAKGFHLLLDAFKKLQGDDCMLHVVGTGPLESSLREAARTDQRIDYRGYVAGDEKFKLLSRMHYLVTPSLCYENSPTVIYEAFSVGVPVIASSIGGTAELVEDGGNGYIFEADKQDALHAALVRARQGHTGWSGLSRNAINTVADKGIEIYCRELVGTILTTD